MKLIFFVLFFAPMALVAKKNFELNLSAGAGIYNITRKLIFYDPEPLGGRLTNFMGIDKDGGGTYFIEGSLYEDINQLVGISAGLNFTYRDGYYQERQEGVEEAKFNFVYTGIPLEIILFPQKKFCIMAGFEPNMLISSGGFNERLSYWAKLIYYSHGIKQDLSLNRLNVNAKTGIELKVWKVILSTNYYHSLLPFLNLYSPKPTAATYDGVFEGRLDFYNSGFEIKLKVPIKQF
ncbi:MAG: hypothetical protein ACERKD_09770 [Prolixibacteraceae bacterium]